MSITTKRSSIDNVLLFSISDIENLCGLYDNGRQARIEADKKIEDRDLEIDNLREYVHHLESTIAVLEEERDFYKNLLVG